MFEGMPNYFDAPAWEHNYRQRCQEELGGQVVFRQVNYGEFEVALKGEADWLHFFNVTFTLEEMADVEALIVKVKSLLREVA